MAIQIKYFASLRDRLGRTEDQLPVDNAMTIRDIWHTLWPDTPMPANVLAAINQEYADLDDPVKDGDELAFFPPVTGG